ncbi:MAG: ATP-grasp domain-containing protein [Methanomethylovorans sp.]|uniref:carboxylate--amine ligase n=1 Tax=Methanomethylovorans sp. TaxID=2758717 RepID=UPI003530BA0D
MSSLSATSPKVLVTDSQMRNSLAVIRSLGKKGFKVTAGDETRFSTGMFSRYCSDKLIYPSPKNPDHFAEFILELVKEKEYDAVFPITDSTVLPIVKNKRKFSKYTMVPFPDYDILSKAIDKGETIKKAVENGIPCPKTFFIEKIEDLEDIKNNLPYPVVIKPRVSYGSRGVVICKSPDEVIPRFQQIVQDFGPALIQEYVPKRDEVGVYTLFNHDSEPRAVSVQRRIRSYPISGGPSTLRETIDNPELIDMAFKLLKALNWTGLAMVEFRIDSRDNTPKLMEINPRFWGSLELSILSGVDFPYLLYKLMKEGDVEPVMDYKKGIKCRWLLPGDILWYFSSPSKMSNLPEFLNFSTKDDILSFNDPGPTFGFMLAAGRFMFDRNMWKFMIRKPIEER